MGERRQLRSEIKKLYEIITERQTELERLETIVMKYTEPHEVEERKKKVIDVLRKQMDDYSQVLESYSLPDKPRTQTTSDFLTELFNQSQQLKTKRDEYLAAIPEAETKLSDMKSRIKEHQNKLLGEYKQQLQQFKAFFDAFQLYKDSFQITIPDTILKPMTNSSQTAREIKSSYQHDLNEAIENAQNSYQKKEIEYNQKINEYQQDIEKSNKLIKNFRKAEERAQKLYEESLDRRLKAQEVTNQLKHKLVHYRSYHKKFIHKSHRFINKKDSFFNESDQNMVKLIDQLTKMNEKLKNVRGNFGHISSNLQIKIDPEKNKFTVSFKALRNFYSTRENVLNIVPNNELEFFLMPRKQLLERYRRAKRLADEAQEQSDLVLKKEREELEELKKKMGSK